MTLESFSGVYDDERVGEIVIVDDASDWGLYTDLKDKCALLPKVKLYRNLTNCDCYVNKANAISYASNDYCILLDSDNIIDKSYIDNIFDYNWHPECIIAPVYAAPNFDYREFEGMVVTKENVAELMNRKMFSTALNTANYFVNGFSYIGVWDAETDPVTSDSIFMAYQWLSKGYQILFSPGLTYQHRVHPGSHYQTQNHRTPQGFHESILQKLKELK